MRTITQEELKNLLQEVSDRTMVTFHHFAEPDMRKKGNPFLGCVRHATVVGMIGFTYEGVVNADFMPDGFKTFQAGPRVWGLRIEGTPLVAHKGEFYLETLPNQCVNTYWIGDKMIPKSEIEPFLKRPETSELDMPRPKDYKLSGIQWIELKGVRYKVE